MAFKGQPTATTVHQVPRAKISDGKSVLVTVPASTEVKPQSIVLLDGFLGIAMQGAKTAAGETTEIALNIAQEEYETDQITVADTFDKGAAAYFDKATKLLTTVKSTNVLVGKVTAKKDANNVIQFILLPQQA